MQQTFLKIEIIDDSKNLQSLVELCPTITSRTVVSRIVEKYEQDCKKGLLPAFEKRVEEPTGLINNDKSLTIASNSAVPSNDGQTELVVEKLEGNVQVPTIKNLKAFFENPKSEPPSAKLINKVAKKNEPTSNVNTIEALPSSKNQEPEGPQIELEKELAANLDSRKEKEVAKNKEAIEDSIKALDLIEASPLLLPRIEDKVDEFKTPELPSRQLLDKKKKELPSRQPILYRQLWNICPQFFYLCPQFLCCRCNISSSNYR